MGKEKRRIFFEVCLVFCSQILEKSVENFQTKLKFQPYQKSMAEFHTLFEREFLKEYRERSILIGKEIVYSRGNEKYAAIAEDIDQDGALVVRYEDGKMEALKSGEVSVRAKANQASLPFPAGNA